MFVYLLSWAELGWAGLGWAGLGWTWSSGREAGGGWGRLDGEVRVRYSISGVHSTGQPSPSLVVAPVITIHCPATGLIGRRRCYVILFWDATTLRGMRRLCKNTDCKLNSRYYSGHCSDITLIVRGAWQIGAVLQSVCCSTKLNMVLLQYKANYGTAAVCTTYLVITTEGATNSYILQTKIYTSTKHNVVSFYFSEEHRNK